MIRKRRGGRGISLCLGALLLGAALGASAQEVWSGRSYFFEKGDYADWTLPENQDRISDAVWLTRQNTQGLFNIAQEESYGQGSPLDTEWATGNAADWAGLVFSSWSEWNGHFPPGMIAVDAVVHLISEDIYLDIRFESWTQADQGGGFSYVRAVDPTAVGTGTWGAVKALFR